MSKFQELGGVIKRNSKRSLGIFVDGTGLDRATRRIKRKVEISKLIKGVSLGLTPVVCRYYTLIPHEDDSRQRSFLDAIMKSGIDVVVKRLPPKGVNRQVSVSVEMAADIVAFAMGCNNFSNLGLYTPDSAQSVTSGGALPSARKVTPEKREQERKVEVAARDEKEERIITVVCPSRDVSYSISLANEFNTDTITADFGQFKSNDVLKSAAKWIDLSDSETIWRE